MLLDAALLTSLGAVELRWASVAGCPDAAVVARELDALVQEDASRAAAAATVDGRLVAEREAYVLRLEIALAGAREARELRASDCAVLTRAGVLVAAVTLDALATTAAVDASPSPAPEPTGVPPPASATVDPFSGTRPAPGPEPEPPGAAPADRPAARVPSGGTLAASAGLAQGMTPRVTGGIEGRFGWRRGALRLVVGGFHWFSRSVELEPAVGVESALSGASLRGCVAFGGERLEAPLCAGADLAAMHGGGIGAAVRRRAAADLWIGVAAGAGVVFWATRRFALEARVEGVIGARRPAMFLSIAGTPREAFRMEPVGVRLLVGPMVRVW